MLVTQTDVVVHRSQEPLGPDALALLDTGAGLLVQGSGPWDAAVLALLADAGLHVACRDEARGPLAAAATGDALDEDLCARVTEIEGTVGGHVTGGTPVLRDRHGGVVAAVSSSGRRRVAVVAADLTEGPSARALVENLRTWVAPPATSAAADARRGPGLPLPAAWSDLRTAVTGVQGLQDPDGSVREDADRRLAGALVEDAARAVEELAPHFPHDQEYLTAVVTDLRRWADEGLGVPDFLDSLVVFQPQKRREDGLRHLVVFPMYTQNGRAAKHLEALVVEVLWPDFVADLEAHRYTNPLFVPIRFVDFTAGYDTNSAVLFPETVTVREIPTFTWGAIFADREAARFRRVVRAAASTTRLALPPEVARLLASQRLTEETFVLWDLIHDRTHMRGDLPFDPFMIKQRMPFFLYSLEELRCDLTAFREAVRLEEEGLPHARLVQHAILLDRIFRFPITGSRVRNYDGLGGQLLFAWLHQRRVLHWTDNRLTVDWHEVPAAVLALGSAIEDLYWRSIDRPKVAHWLAAYDLVSATLTPHPASTWAKGPGALPLDGPPKGLTDAVLPDEFPLSMFYEALQRRIGDVVASTSGITAAEGDAEPGATVSTPGTGEPAVAG